MLIYNPNEQISKHFKMYEITQSQTAERDKIDNTPSSDVLEAASLLAQNVLEPIREHFGISFSPTSWFRCEQLERAINEKTFKTWCLRRGLNPTQDSWKQYFALKSHPRGEAADIKIPGITNDALIKWIEDNIPVYDQLIREFPKANDPNAGWVHVSYSATTNRKEFFIIS